MVFFTSDQHFGHWNINQYCNRGFSSLEEMDDTLIEAWNSVVGPEDVLYHLGDFCLGSWNDAVRYIMRLNGKIFFLLDRLHHDRRWMSGSNVGTQIWVGGSSYSIEFLPPIHELIVEDKSIILCHHPFAVWDKKHYGSWHLHGHIHNRQMSETELILNVGVDAHETWAPLSLEQVVKFMEVKNGDSN